MCISYITYYVLINFWLCYVIKFTWRIQQRWKTFDATVVRGACPFLTLKKKNFKSSEVGFIPWQIINGQNPQSTYPNLQSHWVREREKTLSLFVCLFFWKLEWGHHTINEPAVGKYRMTCVINLFLLFSASWKFQSKYLDAIDRLHKILLLITVK